jgi:hypothetical protein
MQKKRKKIAISENSKLLKLVIILSSYLIQVIFPWNCEEYNFLLHKARHLNIASALTQLSSTSSGR